MKKQMSDKKIGVHIVNNKTVKLRNKNKPGLFLELSEGFSLLTGFLTS